MINDLAPVYDNMNIVSTESWVVIDIYSMCIVIYFEVYIYVLFG